MERDLLSEEAWHPEQHVTFEEPRPIKFRLYVAKDGCEAMVMHGKGSGLVEDARPATVADLKAAGFVPYAELKAMTDLFSKVRIAGGRLSNLAYNLAQDEKLDPLTRNSLNETYKAWDEACK